MTISSATRNEMSWNRILIGIVFLLLIVPMASALSPMTFDDFRNFISESRIDDAPTILFDIDDLTKIRNGHRSVLLPLDAGTFLRVYVEPSNQTISSIEMTFSGPLNNGEFESIDYAINVIAALEEFSSREQSMEVIETIRALDFDQRGYIETWISDRGWEYTRDDVTPGIFIWSAVPLSEEDDRP